MRVVFLFGFFSRPHGCPEEVESPAQVFHTRSIDWAFRFGLLGSEYQISFVLDCEEEAFQRGRTSSLLPLMMLLMTRSKLGVVGFATLDIVIREPSTTKRRRSFGHSLGSKR